jgi:hypothetical protein
VNECCICRGPHFVHRCWHILGLPEGIAAVNDNFPKQHAANEGPWNRQQQQHANDRPRPPHQHQYGQNPRSNDRLCVSAVIPQSDVADATKNERSYSNVVNNSVASIQNRSPRSGPFLSALRPTSGSTTSSRNNTGQQSVLQEAVDYVQEQPLQGYCSPLVNHFIGPTIASIINEPSPIF